MTALASVDPRSVDHEAADPETMGGRRIEGWATATTVGALALPIASAAAGAAVFWLVRGALIDDAYITLSYARNLATDLHWGLIPTEPANSATSPLNVMLLAAATALLRVTGGVHPVWGLAGVVVGLATLMGHWWRQVGVAFRLPGAVPALGVALLLTNPFILSATGLEVLLVPTMLLGLLAMATRGRAGGFGVVAGLAMLSRLDLVVFVVPIALLTPSLRRRLLTAVAAAVAVAGPWFAWSWVHFGSAIPDTFVIKTLQRSFGPSTFVNGWRLYAERDGLATAVTFLPGIAGAAAVGIWLAAWAVRRGPALGELAPVAAFGLGGLLYLGLYAAMEVPPYQWYYVPSFAALTTSLCVLVGSALRGRRVADDGRGAPLLAGRHDGRGAPLLARRDDRTADLAVQGAGASVSAHPRARPPAGARRRIDAPPVALRGTGAVAVATLVALLAVNLTADLRHGSPWRTPPVFGNWATPADYARVGRELGDRVGDATVEAPPEIGTLAYFCECSIVDAFADRGRTIPLIDARLAAAGPLARRALDLNYLLLDRDQAPRPAAYRLTWDPGPATSPDQWQTWSPATGVGHMTLIPLPPVG